MALAASWAARTMPADTTIAAVFPDGPQRYFDTVYNDEYCQAHDLIGAPAPPTEPRTISDPLTQVASSWTRCPTIIDPTCGPHAEPTS